MKNKLYTLFCVLALIIQNKLNAQVNIEIDPKTGIVNINGNKVTDKTAQETEIYNAYSLAKVLHASIPKDSTDKHEIAFKVINAVNWYCPKNYAAVNHETSNSNLLKYQNLLFSYEKIDIAKIDTSHTKYKNLFNTLNIKIKEINELEKKLTKPESQVESLDTILSAFQNKITEEIKTKIDEIVKDTSKTDSSKLASIPEILNIKIETSEIETKISSQIQEAFDNEILKINNEISALKTEVVKLILADNNSIEVIKLITDEEYTPTIAYSKTYNESYNQKGNLNSELIIKLAAQSASSPFNFSLPSQAEMIDAVAIYLAKRVKQEVTLWFFDEIRDKAKNYLLLKAAFPETIEMLSKLESYEAPNMGSSWRYALAKDFVTMPENLLNKDVIKNEKVEEALEYVEIGFKVYPLINKSLSYREIITQLYLEYPDRETAVDSSIKRGDIITLLYAINTELYKIEENNGVVQLTHLDYNLLRTLSVSEIITMVNLINAKYDNILEKFIGKVSNDPKNIEEAIRWIGKIGMALEEFSHILKEYQALAEARRNGEQNAMMNYVYEAPSVFKLTISLVESLIPSSKTSEIRFAKAEKGIEYLEDILEAYELYSNKNYAGGTIKVVEIASKLFSIDSTFIVKLEKGDKSKYQPYTTEFKRLKLPISELVKTQKDSIQKFLGSLNLESTKDTASLTKLIPKSFEKEIRKIIKDKPQLDKSIQTALNNLMTQKKDSLETFLGKLDSILIIDTASLNKYIPKYLSEKNYPLFKNLREELQIMDTFKINLKPALNNVAALNEVTRLASFLNDVALSTDSKGLSKVIESYAMPPGSYKKKRNSWMSVDLNAYVGAYTGIEKIRDIDLDKKVIGTYGVTAPIGLTLSWNRRKEITDNSIKLSDTYLEEYKFTDEGILKKRKPVTFYIHTTIVDLGAIVAFKIGNPVVDSTDLEMQKFRWEQFFSPGLTFGIGIPKTPLVASVGYQFAPQIRKLSLETEQFDAHRFSIGILVDIPLFNIWMKRYSKLPKDNK